MGSVEAARLPALDTHLPYCHTYLLLVGLSLASPALCRALQSVLRNASCAAVTHIAGFMELAESGGKYAAQNKEAVHTSEGPRLPVLSSAVPVSHNAPQPVLGT
eukprot:6183802-Pleurochrysis_carterae.AAC.2